MSENKPMGRPPVPDELKRDILLRVMVTEAERLRMQRAAEKSGASLSSWLRQLALKASEQFAANPRELSPKVVEELFPLSELEKGIDAVLNGPSNQETKVKELKKLARWKP
jgi:hypothetical protein